MDATKRCGDVPGPDGATIPQLPGESERTSSVAGLCEAGLTVASYSPWQEIDTGRYMPRRIRGSCRGRELG